MLVQELMRVKERNVAGGRGSAHVEAGLLDRRGAIQGSGEGTDAASNDEELVYVDVVQFVLAFGGPNTFF